jgi:dUTP pyrophosphatase
MILYDCFKEGATFKKATDGSAGFDLSSTDHVIPTTLGFTTVHFGVRVAIPDGFVGLLTLRSSLGRTLLASTTPGIIDSDYRGELQLRVRSQTDNNICFSPGTRMAQLVIVPICTMPALAAEISENETPRGAGGFGSTGK